MKDLSLHPHFYRLLNSGKHTFWTKELSVSCGKGYKPTKEDIKANQIIHCATMDGDFELLKWMTKKFQLTAEDARSCNNLAFRHAALNGHLETLKWLADRFQLTVEDIRAENDEVLKSASRFDYEPEYSDILKWLSERFRIT